MGRLPALPSRLAERRCRSNDEEGEGRGDGQVQSEPGCRERENLVHVLSFGTSREERRWKYCLLVHGTVRSSRCRIWKGSERREDVFGRRRNMLGVPHGKYFPTLK